MRRNGALAADYARRHGVRALARRRRRDHRAPDIDAVYIATLTDSHREYTLRCAAAGKPVYVEKPMGMNHAQCVEMVDGMPSGRRAAVGRLLPPRAAALPRRARPARSGRDRRRAHGGHVPDAATAGARRSPAPQVPWRVEPRVVRRRLLLRGVLPHVRLPRLPVRPDRRGARLRRQPGGRATGPRTSIAATYRFASGVYGSGAWCYAADSDTEYTELIGATGRLRFSTFAPVPIRVLRGDTVEVHALRIPRMFISR